MLNESIRRMASEITGILEQRLHSFWLYGSVVLDDFRLGWSDIDFIALSDGPIAESQADQLLMLRQHLAAQFPSNPYYRCFEGIIASLPEYLDRDFTRLVYWGTTGQRVTDQVHEDPFALFELAQYGRCVLGNADRSIFPVPGREKMIAAIRSHYETIRTVAVRTDERLYSCGWLLDMARCVYTLRYDDVASKTQAGRWALSNHVFPDEPALEKTLMIRQNPLEYKDRPEIKLWLKDLGPTVQRYADVLEKEIGVCK